MRSLRQKLLLFILPLCLVPLIGISIFSYYEAKGRITEDRIVLYLEQIALDIADTIRLTLLERTEETVSMTLYSEFRDFLLGRIQEPPQLLLDKLIVVHEVYDVLAVFDVQGRLVVMNSINRNRIEEHLDETVRRVFTGTNLVAYTKGSDWLHEVRSGRLGYIDWHASEFVHNFYDYFGEDVANQYCIGFAAPILDEQQVVIGGILALMNWQYIQEILDKVEMDFEESSISSGYAFLFAGDANTIIGHKYRRNRNYQRIDADEMMVARDNYGIRLQEDLQLYGLHRAVRDGFPYFRYEYPAGTAKISGLSPIDHDFFRWICGVGINDEDIFAPVQDLLEKLLLVTSLSILAVLALTFSISRHITIPLKKLTQGVRVIARGDLSQRVDVSSRDEIGELAETFNEMARSLEERSRALIELNKKLEDKVRERTRELEDKNDQLRKAYQELKQAQVQLIQSEKMASLGQLVAGIAHEIKNPLNFIYGNTDFLKTYITDLKQLLDRYESKVRLDPEESREIDAFKQRINYSFLVEDLDALIRNFEEGAKRIHSIIDDLRTFSRTDGDHFHPADIHEPIELALNLLQNEYRDRIQIHREYSELPPIECHPGKLSQVFMNLLSNACHAIPGEGEIWIRTFPQNGMAVIELEDSGVGIEQEHVGKIFEPFYTTKPVGRGTGLGLSISYGIIRQHGGEITVESRRGQGTMFRIQLPLK